MAVLPVVRSLDRRKSDKKDTNVHIWGELNILQLKREFWGTLAIILIVFVVMALPHGLTETYGLQAKNFRLLVHVVSAIFSATLLIWWLARYRQTSHDIETLREEIEREIRSRNESEQDNSTLDS